MEGRYPVTPTWMCFQYFSAFMSGGFPPPLFYRKYQNSLPSFTQGGGDLFLNGCRPIKMFLKQ